METNSLAIQRGDIVPNHQNLQNLNVYYWPEVLQDYDHGAIISIAYDFDTAMKQVLDKIELDRGKGYLYEQAKNEMKATVCYITPISQPFVFYIPGGS